MKAVYVKAPFHIETRDLDLDQPSPGQALIRIKACAICGSDMQTARIDARDWKPLGREIAGVVERVGHDIGHLKPGDSVVLEISSFYGNCEQCRNGRVDLVRRQQVCGAVEHGFLGIHVGLRDKSCAVRRNSCRCGCANGTPRGDS